MNKHRKKMIAPIIVTAILVAYYIAYFAVLMALLGIVGKILLAIIPILLSAITIAVCRERIQEIKGGEEDDIGKY